MIRELIILALLAGCGAGGELGGSIGGEYDLEFDGIRAYQVGAELVIAFEKSFEPEHDMAFGATVMNQVVRLTLNTDRLALEKKVEIPLDGVSAGYPCGDVGRYVVRERDGRLSQESAFPDVLRLWVRFSELPVKLGAQIKGKFETTFADDRTLGGSFDTTLSEP